MDVQKTIEFILEQQAQSEARFAKIENHLTSIAERQDQAAEERAIDKAYLRHAVRLAIQEARNERSKRREMDAKWDEKITQLAAAQLVTEEKLQGLSLTVDAFIKSMHRGGNGHA